MKKILSIVLILITFATVLVGCGSNESKIPDYFTEYQYHVAERMLEVYDEFLDAKISHDEFSEKIDILKARLGDYDTLNDAMKHLYICCGALAYPDEHPSQSKLTEFMERTKSNRGIIQSLMDGEYQ